MWGGPRLCNFSSAEALPSCPPSCPLLPPLQLFCKQLASGHLVILAGKASRPRPYFALPSHLLPLLWLLTRHTLVFLLLEHDALISS